MSGIYLSSSEVSSFAEAMFADLDALPEVPGESEASGNVLAAYTFTVAANPKDEAQWFGASIREINEGAP